LLNNKTNCRPDTGYLRLAAKGHENYSFAI